MNDKTLHEIANLLHQIISNAQHIAEDEKFKPYTDNIKSAAYKIDAYMTDSTVDRESVEISKAKKFSIDLKKFANLKVLIVDDIEENIYITKSIFETLSCEIQTALSGEEALAVYQSGFDADIVCMDMIMPGISGDTTTLKLKKLGCSAYFIAISALKNQPHSVVSLFDSWLPKPYTQEHIMGALIGYETCKKAFGDSPQVDAHHFKLSEDIPEPIKNQILILAKQGNYSELSRVIETLTSSPSKEFLEDALKKIDFVSIMKSIVSP